MNWIIKQDPYFKDLNIFSSRCLRQCLDLHYRSRLLAEKKIFANLDVSKLKILDFGAGENDFQKRYRPAHYQTLDPHLQATWKTVSEIPADEKFDLIVASEVFEHLVDPQQTLSHLARRQKPGQKIYITTPFLAREHGAPNDFQRWTVQGLEDLLSANGYKIEVSLKRGNIISVLSALINYPFFRSLRSVYFPLAVLFSPVVLGLLGLAQVTLKRPAKSVTYLGISILATKI